MKLVVQVNQLLRFCLPPNMR